MKRCKKCVMPVIEGKVSIDAAGICNICKREGKRKFSFSALSATEKENILINKVKKYKVTGKYDCIVSLSGGKDSIMTLYIAREKLGLHPLAVFIDNGFILPEMYENINNVVDKMGIDLITFKNTDIKKIFNLIIDKGRDIYICRVCHVLMDVTIKKICKENNIHLLLGGYTKGQNYFGQSELYKIFKESDNNFINLLKKENEFGDLIEIFNNPQKYMADNFFDINSISPFRYLEYNEEKIINFITKKYNFKAPKNSWPSNSSNCSFNFVSQYMARKDFGFSQHETELSELVREGEIKRAVAIKNLNTPIKTSDLKENLSKINLKLKDLQK